MPGAFLGYEGADRGAYDTAHLFPFTYEDLIPYYRWVEASLPVQTAPMGTKEQVFFQGAEGLGLPVQTTKDITRAAFRPQENAILQPKGTAGKTDDPKKLVFPQAQGCTFAGHCLQGCYLPLGAPRNLKAKRSTDNSYIPMALTADLWTRKGEDAENNGGNDDDKRSKGSGKAATLVTDAFATKIITDNENGQLVARAVTWRLGNTGEMVTEEARVIAVACGPIETPRLWLNSGLPNPNGWVGRGITDHLADLVTGVFPFDTNSSKGPTSAARADFPGFGSLQNIGLAPANQAAFLNLSQVGIAGFNGLGGGAHSVNAEGRLVGKDLKTVMSDVDRLLTMLILTDDDVEPQNRVALSAAPAFTTDEHGRIPRVEVNHQSPRTLSNREFLVGQAVGILRAAGATRIYRMNIQPALVHIHSTMRMGLNENDSVLDENAEARWVKRLFIADQSALANAVGGPNPTLTTQALATRTAEKIFQLYFGGDPWVVKEKPVSSIDPQVTKAVRESGGLV
jgi:choline dehydrogenase-like flavoprotein